MDHSRPTETENEVLDSVSKLLLQQTQAGWWKLFDPDLPGERDRYYEMGPPLYYASLLGLQRTAQLLLDKGEDINAQGVHGSALQQASAKDHEGIVQLLLAKGADVDMKCKGEPRTALQLASYEGHEGIVKLLLAKGADVNAMGDIIGNALQLASIGGHEGIVKLLLAKGTDVNVYNKLGTALQLASHNGYEGIVQLLLSKGADINAQGEFGSALQ
ncbi:unnamed protein product [Penicillium nalgiovense]|nr:unnamed protein product [Penicillium nalgiovense]